VSVSGTSEERFSALADGFIVVGRGSPDPALRATEGLPAPPQTLDQERLFPVALPVSLSWAALALPEYCMPRRPLSPNREQPLRREGV
jgi:hypothetical protein